MALKLKKANFINIKANRYMDILEKVHSKLIYIKTYIEAEKTFNMKESFDFFIKK